MSVKHNNRLHIGIDATNIRHGGGITHLSMLLESARPSSMGIASVTVWAPKPTLQSIANRSWISKKSSFWMYLPLPLRIVCQQIFIPIYIKKLGGDVLFSPGGTLPLWPEIPSVTMSQNMLPFEQSEVLLFGSFNGMRLKMFLLRLIQSYSFRRAAGVIFLSNYARVVVSNVLGAALNATALIPHGIERRFFRFPRCQRAATECSLHSPFRLLYISTVMPYKHQLEVARVVAALRQEGIPLEISFVGRPFGEYGRRLETLIKRLDPRREFLFTLGECSFLSLHEFYHEADLFVFASSCENLPNILIEAMAAGLPIASSQCGPMREILGDVGVYFDPYVPRTLSDALRSLFYDSSRRQDLAQAAWRRAHAYSWERCSLDTFTFIAQVARKGCERKV